jgi:hypothetical protein
MTVHFRAGSMGEGRDRVGDMGDATEGLSVAFMTTTGGWGDTWDAPPEFNPGRCRVIIKITIRVVGIPAKMPKITPTITARASALTRVPKTTARVMAKTIPIISKLRFIRFF